MTKISRLKNSMKNLSKENSQNQIEILEEMIERENNQEISMERTDMTANILNQENLTNMKMVRNSINELTEKTKIKNINLFYCGFFSGKFIMEI